MKSYVTYLSAHYFYKINSPYNKIESYNLVSVIDNAAFIGCFPRASEELDYSFIRFNMSTEGSSKVVGLGGDGETWEKDWWQTWGAPVDNLNSLATSISSSFKSSHIDGQDINLYLFTGKLIDQSTGELTVKEYIIPFIYYGNNQDADEVIEV